MAAGKFDDSRVLRGKRVAIWAYLIFFIVSVIGTLGIYLFGEWLTPILMKKNKEETEKAVIERMQEREGTKQSVR